LVLVELVDQDQAQEHQALKVLLQHFQLFHQLVVEQEQLLTALVEMEDLEVVEDQDHLHPL
tara:strand:+ start:112 stop:294 length:183 start_codon:yes stop_codon:yes gene_type:complete